MGGEISIGLGTQLTIADVVLMTTLRRQGAAIGMAAGSGIQGRLARTGFISLM